MNLLLSEPLPLRTTQMLGDFAEATPLPQRYGDLTSGRFRLIRLDASTFFAADHPMAMDRCFIDKQPTESWASELRSDAAGNTWTVVKFAAPVPPEADVSATGTGKRNPTTGALLENPAEIIEDVLRLAGRSESWDFLRAECAAAGIRLAGSITETRSIRATIDEIATSAAAIWTPSMARLYPTATIAGYVQELDKMLVSNLVVKADLTNTADVVRVFYDPDSASEKAQHFVELSSNPQIYGGVVRDFTLDWLRSPSNAEAVGRRLLPWFAGARYDVEFDCGDKSVRPGQWVRLVDHPEWPFDGADPEIMILGAEIDQDAKTSRCRGATVLTAPDIEVTGHSVALPTIRDAGVEVGVKDGVATFRITDENDLPIFNARVALDGGASKMTDEQGTVSFTVKPGEHRLAIEAPGKVANVLTVTV